MTRVFIIGGYGNFGRFISKRLAQEDNFHLIIAGRSLEKAQTLAQEVKAEAIAIDINNNLTAKLQEIKPDIAIHTSGPYQNQGCALY